MRKEIHGHRFFLLADYGEDLINGEIETFPTLEEVLKELRAVPVDEAKQTSTSLVPVGVYCDQEMQPLGCTLPLKGYDQYENTVKQVLDRCCAIAEHDFASLKFDLELDQIARWAESLPSDAVCQSLGVMSASTPRADDPWVLSTYKEDGDWYVTYVKVEVKYLKYLCGVIGEILDEM